ncbi:MAG: hypothetical protein ACYC4R_14270 [Anaerolineae bacterium]
MSANTPTSEGAGQGRIEALLAGITPARLQALIPSLAATQAPDNREAVSLASIVDALTGGADLGTGAEGWAVQLRLKQAIRDAVAQIPEMRFIEGDS